MRVRDCSNVRSARGTDSQRPGYPEIAAAALADCRAFMTRERSFELRLIGRLQGTP